MDDPDKSDESRFWLNASRALEDEKAVREFLRGEGRGIDGAVFRAFVRRCRREVGPEPVFEPAINMVLNGVHYRWGVWFRPRPKGDTSTEGELCEQQAGLALPERPPVDMVTTRGEDGAVFFAAQDESAEESKSVDSASQLPVTQTVFTSSASTGSPSPTRSSPASPSPAAPSLSSPSPVSPSPTSSASPTTPSSAAWPSGTSSSPARGRKGDDVAETAGSPAPTSSSDFKSSRGFRKGR